ncbi:Alpha/Beta hydrolase protein [Gorgonomyces haynaldii]|nr:Alpha/Beta hydrolase protein [Gorgonomyces haynaldii]
MLSLLLQTVQALAPVQLDTLTVQGATLGNVNFYLGIPFAEPPTGARRFLPPVPLKKRTGTFDATKFGPACVQSASSTTESEDCLNLNVFTPVNATATSKLPVLVYVYGGAFNSGSNRIGLYDGRATLQSGTQAVMVVMNYRVGAFGFLASKELLAKGMTNPGLLDQKLAFEWVKKNIAKFGGDPTRITAFGQSAGAISLGAHLIAQRGTQKLFTKLALFSGATALSYNKVDKYQAQFDTLSTKLACTGDIIKCLQNKTATDLFTATQGFDFAIISGDNYICQDSPQAFASKQFSKVPLLANADKDEGTFFTTTTSTLDGVKQLITSFGATGADVDQALQLYPAASFAAPQLQAAQIFSDAVFVCPEDQLLQQMSAFQPTFKTFFTKIATTPVFGSSQLGAFHGSDLQFWFQLSQFLDADEKVLAAKMLDQLFKFATSKPDLIPSFTTGNELVWNVNVATQPLSVDRTRCEFWKRITSAK